jgi:glycosyltransferase involved in cell wall biosynthesis
MADRPSALLIRPAFPKSGGGGLALALSDLSRVLRERGWSVDDCDSATEGATGGPSWHVAAPLAGTLGSDAVVRAQSRVPRRLRRWVVELSRPSEFLAEISTRLERVERLLRQSTHDLVLVCPDTLPPGILDLATSLHPRVVAITLMGLAEELRYDALWSTMRVVTRARAQCHRSLGCAVAPTALHHAVFASESWRRAAIYEGFPEGRATTIYFGVEVDDPPNRPCWRNRLLWVGRLAPEKGLHALLRSVPDLRNAAPGLRLTAITASGPRSYERLIERLVRRVDGADSVTIEPSRPRNGLRAAYDDHDALVFFSVFREPVALVVLEAFAAGLPVIASRPATPDGPLREDETCICFDAANPQSLVEAVARCRTDAALRERISASARALVQREYSLEGMAAAYDALLRRVRWTSGL